MELKCNLSTILNKEYLSDRSMETSFVDPWHFGTVRIRIRGSVPLTYGSGSCFFRQWLTRCQQKIIFFQRFFAYYYQEDTMISVFIDKKTKRSHKILQVDFKVFLHFFAF